MNRIVIISVHPDDETLGCGGTILKHQNNGDEIYWLIITNVKNSEVWSKEYIANRQSEIKSVAEKYNFQDVIKLNYDTTQLDQIPISDMVSKLSHIFTKYYPDIIYINNRSDIHTDHKIAFKAITSATKSFNQPSIKKLLMYETISETDFAPSLPENAFSPNYFVDISEFLEKKIEIMKIYHSEMRDHPFPRSDKNIRALATYRGAQCGVEAAEAFMIIKEIW